MSFRSVACTAVAVGTCLSGACSDMPSPVFVPGTGYRESLFVTSEQGVRAQVAVGQPLLLHAERLSGPWRLSPRDSVAEDGCWLPSAPLEHEIEVRMSVDVSSKIRRRALRSR